MEDLSTFGLSINLAEDREERRREHGRSRKARKEVIKTFEPVGSLNLADDRGECRRG